MVGLSWREKFIFWRIRYLLLHACLLNVQSCITFFTCIRIHNNPETSAKMPLVRNCPRFVEPTVVDRTSSYFLFMEQAVICSVKSFTKAFLWFVLHYIFNLEYDKRLLGKLGCYSKNLSLDYLAQPGRLQRTWLLQRTYRN